MRQKDKDIQQLRYWVHKRIKNFNEPPTMRLTLTTIRARMRGTPMPECKALAAKLLEAVQ